MENAVLVPRVRCDRGEAHTQTHTNAHTHTHTQTGRPTYMHTHTHTFTHTCIVYRSWNYMQWLKAHTSPIPRSTRHGKRSSRASSSM